MKVLISGDPYEAAHAGENWNGRWPCQWVQCPNTGAAPFVTAYRLKFRVEEAATVRVHVTADERYELFLDGERIGRGPERGDANHWFFETYDLQFAPGAHVLVARAWSAGELSPFAQMSVHPGFLFSPQEAPWIEKLGTGCAPWEAKVLRGFGWLHFLAAWGTGGNLAINGQFFDWGFEKGEGENWQPVETSFYMNPGNTPRFGLNPARANDYENVHLLTPAMLPAMLDRPFEGALVRNVSAPPPPPTGPVPILEATNLSDEAAEWQSLLDSKMPLQIPPHTRRRILIDADTYLCAYPEVITSGGRGAYVRVHWQESLFTSENTSDKGNRDEIEGKYFYTLWWRRDGVGDLFITDGGAHRKFETLWWQCGRYIEVLVETKDEALTIESFVLRETRYPLEVESRFESDDKRLEEITPMMVRVLQSCAHETYMDCPFYEQLQYVGDTRLQVLTTYVLTRDDRLPRKAIQLFDWSRAVDGLTTSRYPSRVRQTTRPFSLWWVAMVYDYALWRGDMDFVREMMPGVRAVLDGYTRFINADGLIQLPPGPNFNFMDWVRPEGGGEGVKWEGGAPPNGNTGIHAPANLQWILVLQMAAVLESWLREDDMDLRWTTLREKAVRATVAAFWNEERGLFADNLAHENYSEHAQSLALLAQLGDYGYHYNERIADGLLNTPDLARATIYFSHYLFEAYGVIGHTEKIIERLGLWFNLKERGLRTTIEHPEPTRSDCHAWGAHPLYHYYATLLGIHPSLSGCREIVIHPQPVSLQKLSGNLLIPQGELRLDLERKANKWQGYIDVPEGVYEVDFRLDNKRLFFEAGKRQEIEL